ncbi:MAG: YIP1 family protein [Acidobacteria bacterium]|nr:YIP1 family protein [Acidobacteriota bacterium]MDW7984842.1 YIP1 family protein [Acidobacteriota bacterium]
MATHYEPTEGAIPWEAPGVSPAQGWLESVKLLVTAATDFFRRMAPTTGNYLKPFLFALVCAYIGALFGWIYNTLFQVSLGALTGFRGTEMFSGFVGTGMGLIGILLFTPIGLVLGLLIGTLVFHLMLVLLKAATQPWEATFRVLAYAGVNNLAQVVPIIGGLIGALWWIYLAVVGLREAHRTTTGKAVLAILIPLGILCLCLGALAALGGLALFGLIRQAQQ